MSLKYAELVNSIPFVLRILGRALLILSDRVITQCGHTDSVRLARLFCRSQVVAVARLTEQTQEVSAISKGTDFSVN